jgi:hypothetical protein
MAAAVFDLARSWSAAIVLLVSGAQAVLRSLAGRVVIRPAATSGWSLEPPGMSPVPSRNPPDDGLPSFPLGVKAHTGIIHIEGEVL